MAVWLAVCLGGRLSFMPSCQQDVTSVVLQDGKLSCQPVGQPSGRLPSNFTVKSVLHNVEGRRLENILTTAHATH
jgi:hypothetical protein